METIAVYWEPVIRVYGFDIKKETALLELDVQMASADYWGRCIESLADSAPGFLLMLLQFVDSDTARICMAIQQEHAAACLREIEKFNQNGSGGSLRIHQPVDILFFHGPHFQERYGIATAVFQSIDPQQITLHTVGCTGTSVYLVVGGGQAEQAREMLSASFTVPGFEK